MKINTEETLKSSVIQSVNRSMECDQSSWMDVSIWCGSGTVRYSDFIAFEIDLLAILTASSTSSGLVEFLEGTAGGSFQHEAGSVAERDGESKREIRDHVDHSRARP